MGTCASRKNTNFNYRYRTELILIISRPIRILQMYQETSVDLSNACQLELIRDMMELKKFAKKVDPYMHCNRASPNRNKLKKHRLSRSEEEQLLLKNIWILYLLAQRFTTWDNLSQVQDKKKVSYSIEFFIKTYKEIMEIIL